MKQRWQSQFPSRFMNINQIQINNEIHIFTTISCIFKSFFLPLQRKNRRIMTFDKILDNNTLWAVRYDGALDNALQTLFSQWSDPEWLVDFFLANMGDLESYFKITDINQAIYDTIDDNQRIQCLILDISPEADLDKIFRPLENSRISEMLLGKEKARIKERPQHASWLRIYAIKLEPGCYIITGGAIKLTRTMQEREHTLKELDKMEQVRNYLISNQAIDADGFVDFLSEIQ